MTDKELFEHIDIQEMLEELNIRNVRDMHNGEIAFSCPFPGHSHLDKNPSASMALVAREAPDGGYYPKTSFYCFGCGMKGTAITFLAEYEGVSPISAKRFLRERFAPATVSNFEGSIEGAIKSVLEEKMTSPPPRKLQIIDESVLEEFAVDWFAVVEAYESDSSELLAPEPLTYMLNRNFLPETLEEYNIGYDELSSRITIPARNHDGFLVGFKGRAWWPDAKPRYKGIGGEEYGFETYESGRILWGLDSVDLESWDGVLFVREGELNALMLRQLGWSNAVGISGKRVSARQLELIKEHADSVVFWFDDFVDSLEAASYVQNSRPVKIIPENIPDPVDSSKDEVSAAYDSAISSLQFALSS